MAEFSTHSLALIIDSLPANQWPELSGGTQGSLDISTGGAPRLSIASGGNVGLGLGAAQPAYKLHVGAGNLGLRVEGPGGPGTALSVGGGGDVSIDAPSVPGGRLLVRHDGNVGIGNPNPQFKLDVAAPVGIRGDATIGAGGNGVLRVRHIDGKNYADDTPEGLYLNWSTRQPVWVGNAGAPAGLLVSGNVGIGTTGPQYALHIKTGWGFLGLDTVGVNQHAGLRLHENGAVKWHFWNDGSASGNNLNINSATVPALVINQNGNLQLRGARVGIYDRRWQDIPSWSGGGLHAWDLFYGGGSYKLSTIREKDDVQPLGEVLARIDRLNPVSFDRRRPDGRGSRDIGFIAEEVREIFPECTAELTAGEPDFFAWGINESALHGIAIAGVQELSRKLKALKRGLSVSRSGHVAIGSDQPLPDIQLHVVGDVRLDCPTSPTASPGAAALPDRPAGFLRLNINGQDCTIPYYHAEQREGA